VPRSLALAAVVGLLAAGCGGSRGTVTITSAARSAARSSTAVVLGSDEVLAVRTLGGFYGLCPRAASVWTLRFRSPAATATDLLTYTVGSDPVRRVEVNPGDAVSFHLIPNIARVREPADPTSGHPATMIATTAPLEVQISQDTEAQLLQVDVRLALTTSGGESGDCALAESWVTARTYPNSAQ
jgi:hypothetical protein